MDPMRKTEIEACVRSQIYYAIERDLTESESLMKETFEHCSGKSELNVAYAEMKRIMKWLKAEGLGDSGL